MIMMFEISLADVGENICVIDLDRRGEQLVKEWYKEIEHYNYSSPGWNKGKAVFLIWPLFTFVFAY